STRNLLLIAKQEESQNNPDKAQWDLPRPHSLRTNSGEKPSPKYGDGDACHEAQRVGAQTHRGDCNQDSDSNEDSAFRCYEDVCQNENHQASEKLIRHGPDVAVEIILAKEKRPDAAFVNCAEDGWHWIWIAEKI